MAESTPEPEASSLLKIFAGRKDGRLSATDLRKKLAAGPHAGEGDAALSSLIEEGLIAVTGGGKTGEHPRPKASYRLTSAGKERAKHQARPAKPGHEDELLSYQESYILLQVFRADEGTLSRSKLNEKLKSKAALQSLEFQPKEHPEAIDYHLFSLVERGHLDEARQGIGVSYALTEEGRQALASTKQHEGATFNLKGDLLNRLLEAAHRSAPDGENVPKSESPPVPEAQPLTPQGVLQLVDRLKSEAYAGKDVIPIHELRRLVAEHHGFEAASHQAFDPLLRRMRSDDLLELIAISDTRETTRQQLDDSIPGINETIFYIVP